MDTIRFQWLADIPVPTVGYSLIANSVAGDGSLLFLSIEGGGAHTVRETYASGGATFAKARMNEPKRFRLAIWRAGEPLQTIELPELDLTFPLVDLLLDGRVLVVSPRCAWRGNDDYDLNGAVLDPKTSTMSRILLGDGINWVFVDTRGRIWVAYNDEGIFGNFGWGNPGPTPIGAAGLVCFAETGEKLWELPPNLSETMADCYALNVSGAEAAIFYYSDFPVCRITSDFDVTCWTTELAGCSAFAIAKYTVLFTGQYKEAPDTAYLGRLESDGHMSSHQVRLVFPDGSSLPRGQKLARGRHMYFFDAQCVYRASLQ